jgi:hypothetical protein
MELKKTFTSIFGVKLTSSIVSNEQVRNVKVFGGSAWPDKLSPDVNRSRYLKMSMYELSHHVTGGIVVARYVAWVRGA